MQNTLFIVLMELIKSMGLLVINDEKKGRHVLHLSLVICSSEQDKMINGQQRLTKLPPYDFAAKLQWSGQAVTCSKCPVRTLNLRLEQDLSWYGFINCRWQVLQLINMSNIIFRRPCRDIELLWSKMLIIDTLALFFYECFLPAPKQIDPTHVEIAKKVMPVVHITDRKLERWEGGWVCCVPQKKKNQTRLFCHFRKIMFKSRTDP